MPWPDESCVDNAAPERVDIAGEDVWADKVLRAVVVRGFSDRLVIERDCMDRVVRVVTEDAADRCVVSTGPPHLHAL